LRACCIRLTVRVGFVTGRETRRRTGHTSKPSGLLWMVVVKWCIISFIWVETRPVGRRAVCLNFYFFCYFYRSACSDCNCAVLLSYRHQGRICRRICCCFLPILRILLFKEGDNIERIPYWLAVLIVPRDDLLFLRLSIFLHLSCISYYPSDKLSVACILVARDSTKKGERGIDCS
jgi:hypothetical protein